MSSTEGIHISSRALAEMLGVSLRTVEGWRLKMVGPPFIRVRGQVRYAMADVQGWIDSNKTVPEEAE